MKRKKINNASVLVGLLAESGTVFDLDLSCLWLGKIDFTGKTLVRCDLSGSTFYNGKLEKCQLTDCDFAQRKLVTNFAGADCQGMTILFRESLLDRCRRYGASLSDLPVSDSAWLGDVSFEGANLTDATFEQANLVGGSNNRLRFVDADLTGVTFERCNIRQVDFTQANMAGVKIYKPYGPVDARVRSGDVASLMERFEPALADEGPSKLAWERIRARGSAAMAKELQLQIV